MCKSTEKFRNPSLRPSCRIFRLPEVLCNLFALLSHLPPEPEQTDGISYHNQALYPFGKTNLGGSDDASHQHHMVEQRPKEEPQDVNFWEFKLAVHYIQRPDADGQTEEDGVEQAGVVAAEVDGLYRYALCR